MPSGKTHDSFTILLAIPIAAVAYFGTREFLTVGLIAATFIFGGLMFGSDLDTNSKQYTRWGIFRFLWYPYQKFFKHRSRWSHGFLFGTFFRVVYFVGVITLVTFFFTFVFMAYLGGNIPHFFEFFNNWHDFGEYIRMRLGKNVFYFAFLGCWLGAASHTIVDMFVTFIKTGRTGKIL